MVRQTVAEGISGRWELDGLKTRQRIEAMGPPGKTPGGPIFFDLLGNSLGDCLKGYGVGNNLEQIADKDSLKNIT